MVVTLATTQLSYLRGTTYRDVLVNSGDCQVEFMLLEIKRGYVVVGEVSRGTVWQLIFWSTYFDMMDHDG